MLQQAPPGGITVDTISQSCESSGETYAEMCTERAHCENQNSG